MAIRREDKVGDEMKRILGAVIQREVKDPRIPPFTSVTSVTVTRDFSYATALISILGTPEQKTEAIKALQKAQGFFRTAVAKQLKLRKTPEITFKLDDTYDTGNRIDQLISDVMGRKSAPSSESILSAKAAASGASEDSSDSDHSTDSEDLAKAADSGASEDSTEPAGSVTHEDAEEL